jgi:hydrogenase/urease accessory protein HupE
MIRLCLLLLVFFAAWPARDAQAHALDPGYLELVPLGEDSWRVTWRIPDIGGRPMPIEAELPVGCSGRMPPPVFDGRAWSTAWVVKCRDGLIGGTVAIAGLERTRTDALVRYELTPGKTQVRRLTAAETSFDVPPEAGPADIFAGYVALGVSHILEGIDHLLFVFALLLLVRGRTRLFWAITAFTVAHSITLAAASLGAVDLPSPPVEAVIALSIVFLAYELTLRPEKRDRVTERYPWIVAFAFGLIHGLGFAGALREIGLPHGDIPLALFSFNVGVELGQILFVAFVVAIWLASVRLYPGLRNKASYLVRMSSYLIGSLAAFWVIQRIAAF